MFTLTATVIKRKHKNIKECIKKTRLNKTQEFCESFLKKIPNLLESENICECKIENAKNVFQTRILRQTI